RSRSLDVSRVGIAMIARPRFSQAPAAIIRNPIPQIYGQPMSQYRVERDSMGELKVPADALYGAQTQRAVDNFPISGLMMPREFIRALGLIKSAAAQANADLGHLKKTHAKAIRKAAERVAAGEIDLHFPIDVFQTGSGTWSNMNANEVIAHVAEMAGAKVHPNDDVNNGQS